jgi:hypothetical protein
VKSDLSSAKPRTCTAHFPLGEEEPHEVSEAGTKRKLIIAGMCNSDEAAVKKT